MKWLQSNLTYFLAFIILTAIYLFISFSYSVEPTGVRITNLLFGFLMSLTVYFFFSFIFIGAAQLTASLFRSLNKSAKQDLDIPDTLFLANMLFIFLFLIYIDMYMKYHADTRSELSLEGFLFYVYPFFTSLIGGMLSGSLVLLSQYDSRSIIQTGRIASITAVLLFFAYHFLTIRS